MKKLPRMSSIETLTDLALDGESGRAWYVHAYSEVQHAAARLEIDAGLLADILAIVSPQVHVKKSVGLALHYLKHGKPKSGTMLSTRQALEHYEETGEIRGRKTSEFARTLRGDLQAVVIDGWMAVAFDIDPIKLKDSPRLYRATAFRIVQVARRLGWFPAEVQSSIWTSVATLRPNEKRSQGDRQYRNTPKLSILDQLA